MHVHHSEESRGDEGRDATGPPPAPAGLCVVTGAAGFIGSHLVDLLLAAGATVAGIDTFDPWYDQGQKRTNLSAARAHPSFSLLEADVGQPGAGDLLRQADVVFHLAGRPGVQDSWGPGFCDASRANVERTQQVYEQALAGRATRVVYASSSSVYGAGDEGPTPDRLRQPRPISPYGVTKLAGEHLAHVYRARGLSVTCLRYFTVYGPRQRPDMAMHRLFEATRTGGPIFVRRGDGTQRREFTYVTDVAAATAAAATAPGAADRTFDVGGGSTASLNEVISRIGAICGRPVDVRTQPAPAGDPHETRADLAPTVEALAWRPRIDLATGLQAQARWHRTRWREDRRTPSDPTPVPAARG